MLENELKLNKLLKIKQLIYNIEICYDYWIYFKYILGEIIDRVY